MANGKWTGVRVAWYELGGVGEVTRRARPPRTTGVTLLISPSSYSLAVPTHPMTRRDTIVSSNGMYELVYIVLCLSIDARPGRPPLATHAHRSASLGGLAQLHP